MIPSWSSAIWLALGVCRLVRLIGWDDLPPIVKLRARVTGEVVYRSSVEATGDIYRFDRPVLAHFLGCAYCQGFWVSLAAYACWLAEPRWTVAVCVPLALSTLVGTWAKNADP